MALESIKNIPLLYTPGNVRYKGSTKKVFQLWVKRALVWDQSSSRNDSNARECSVKSTVLSSGEICQKTEVVLRRCSPVGQSKYDTLC